MERGLNGAGDGLLLIKNNTNKNYLVGENRTAGKAWQGKARQDKAGQEQETFDDGLAQDVKHKEIIKGANEEGNEINTGGAN